MSTEIEQRVVQMKFDNAQFENNTKTTLSTLEKLKDKLKFDKVQDGFSKISTAAGKVDMTSMANATENVRLKFSALEVVAMTALMNITNSAINAGKNIVSSLTIDPIAMGFEEYETQINATQTILANTSSKGTTLDQVNAALDELNTYADKTIYNFTEMTRNIGTFTAAGVELDTSVSAIKGIANLAAVSGSSSQQASTAMYQLSQALAAGKVSLMDWNSVVNAGMGGEIFQEELKRTSRLLGTGVDGAIEKYGTFRESLTEGAWLTTDVLTQTLAKFTGDLSKESLIAQGYTDAQADEIVKLGQMANDAATKVKTFTQLMDTLKEAAQSGWTTTWKILVGDFEEAKYLFTSISDSVGGFIQNISDARNNMLQGWKDMGGRTELLEGLKNILSNIGNILGAIGKAFRKVFPQTTSEQLFNFTKGFRELTEKLKWGDNAIKAVQRTFEGIFSVIKIGVGILALPLKLVPSLIQVFSILGDAIFRVGGFFGNITARVLEFLTSANFLNDAADGIVWCLDWIIGKVRDFVNAFKMPLDMDSLTATIPYLDTIRTKANELKEGSIEMCNKVVESIKTMDVEAAKSKISKTFGTIKDGMGTALDWVVDKLTFVKDKIFEFYNKINWTKVVEVFSGVIAGKFFIDLGGFLKNLGGAMSNLSENVSLFETIGGGIKDTLGTVRDSLESYQKNLKTTMLLKIAAAIGMIAGAVYLLSTIETARLIPALAGVGAMFVVLSGSMILMDKFNTGAGAKGLISMSTALLILANAVTKLSDIEPVKMAIAIAGITALMASMAVYSAVMKRTGGEITKSSVGLIAFAGALLILTSAVRKLTEIEPTRLAIALAGITALSITVAASSKILASGDSGKGSLKLMAYAASIKTLAKATVILADLKWDQLLRGLTGVGILLLELGVFSKLVNEKQMISTSIGMAILAGALLALIVPMKVLSILDWTVFLDGLSKMGIMMTVLGVALKLMPNNLPIIAIGLIGVSSALLVMSGVMKIIATMSWEQISKVIVTLAGSLSILAIALNAMTGTLGGSAALLIASSALIGLSVALHILGRLNLKQIGISLLALGGAMLVLVAGCYALTPVAPILLGMSVAMISFSAALALAGVAMVGIGIGIGAVAAALVSIGTMSGAAIAALVLMVEQMGLILIKMLPLFAHAIGQAIEALAIAIGNAAPVIVEAGVKLMLALLEGFQQVIPKLVDTVVIIIDEVLKTLANHIESITVNIVKILIGVIRGLSLHLPELISETMTLLVNLFKGIFDAAAQLDFSTVIEMIIGAGMFTIFLGAITALAPMIPGAMLALLGFTGLVIETIGVLALIGGIAQIPALEWFVEQGGDLLEKVGVAIGKLFGGIAGGVVKGATSTLPEVGNSLSDFMKNAKVFFDGCKDIDSSTAKSVKTMVESLTELTKTGIIDGIARFVTGGSPMVEFGKQIAEFAPYFRQYANVMAGSDGSELEKTSNAVKTLAEFIKIVPRKSEIADALLGEKSIVAFGEELCAFAPYFRQYSNTMKGVDSDVLVATSNAAMTLAEFAKVVPNKGGLVSLFTGDNSLSSFAEDLIAFGPAIKKYADSVKGIDGEVVTASANAAKTIIEFAKVVPNKGGLVALFTGDNSLSSLAKDLTKFGPSLKAYADSVAGLDSSSITVSINSAKKILELILELPRKMNSLDDFGDNIKDFGKSISKFYNYIEDINAEQLTNSVSGIKQLINLVKGMDGVNFANMSSFAEGMKSLGDTSVQSFVDAFNNSGDKVNTAVSGFINNANMSIMALSPSLGVSATTLVNVLTSAVQSKSPEIGNAIKMAVTQGLLAINSMTNMFASAGTSIMTGLSSGINSTSGVAKSSMNSLVNNLLSTVNNSKGKFTTSGSELANSINSGLNSKSGAVIISVNNMISKMIQTISGKNSIFTNVGKSLISSFANGLSSGNWLVTNNCSTIITNGRNSLNNGYWDWYNSGKYLVQGFANGISANTYVSTAKATNMANAANTAARKALGIHSPSRIGAQIGKFLALGFGNGIGDNTSIAEAQATSMADKAKEALRSALSNIPSILEDDINTSPVITPVLDLNNITKQQGVLDSMFSQNRALELNSIMNRSRNESDGINSSIDNTNNVTFVQNNYSPKSLASIDIYRQTKNQISQLKKGGF